MGYEIFFLHPDNTETVANSENVIKEFGRDDEGLYRIVMENALDAFYEMLEK